VFDDFFSPNRAPLENTTGTEVRVDSSKNLELSRAPFGFLSRTQRARKRGDGTACKSTAQGNPPMMFVSTKPKNPPTRQLSRAEQETETAAERLNTQIEAALAAVAVQTDDGTGDLEACADRLERAARDLSVALRELAQQRGAARET